MKYLFLTLYFSLATALTQYGQCPFSDGTTNLSSVYVNGYQGPAASLLWSPTNGITPTQSFCICSSGMPSLCQKNFHYEKFICIGYADINGTGICNPIYTTSSFATVNPLNFSLPAVLSYTANTPQLLGNIFSFRIFSNFTVGRNVTWYMSALNAVNPLSTYDARCNSPGLSDLSPYGQAVTYPGYDILRAAQDFSVTSSVCGWSSIISGNNYINQVLLTVLTQDPIPNSGGLVRSQSQSYPITITAPRTISVASAMPVSYSSAIQLVAILLNSYYNVTTNQLNLVLQTSAASPYQLAVDNSAPFFLPSIVGLTSVTWVENPIGMCFGGQTVWGHNATSVASLPSFLTIAFNPNNASLPSSITNLTFASTTAANTNNLFSPAQFLALFQTQQNLQFSYTLPANNTVVYTEFLNLPNTTYYIPIPNSVATFSAICSGTSLVNFTISNWLDSATNNTLSKVSMSNLFYNYNNALSNAISGNTKCPNTSFQFDGTNYYLKIGSQWFSTLSIQILQGGTGDSMFLNSILSSSLSTASCTSCTLQTPKAIATTLRASANVTLGSDYFQSMTISNSNINNYMGFLAGPTTLINNQSLTGQNVTLQSQVVASNTNNVAQSNCVQQFVMNAQVNPSNICPASSPQLGTLNGNYGLNFTVTSRFGNATAPDCQINATIATDNVCNSVQIGTSVTVGLASFQDPALSIAQNTIYPSNKTYWQVIAKSAQVTIAQIRIDQVWFGPTNALTSNVTNPSGVSYNSGTSSLAYPSSGIAYPTIRLLWDYLDALNCNQAAIGYPTTPSAPTTNGTTIAQCGNNAMIAGTGIVKPNWLSGGAATPEFLYPSGLTQLGTNNQFSCQHLNSTVTSFQSGQSQAVASFSHSHSFYLTSSPKTNNPNGTAQSSPNFAACNPSSSSTDPCQQYLYFQNADISTTNSYEMRMTLFYNSAIRTSSNRKLKQRSIVIANNRIYGNDDKLFHFHIADAGASSGSMASAQLNVYSDSTLIYQQNEQSSTSNANYSIYDQNGNLTVAGSFLIVACGIVLIVLVALIIMFTIHAYKIHRLNYRQV